MNRTMDAVFWDQLPGFDPLLLDQRARTWNAERWSQRAQMEHASIASFSKFALQLVAVGAPPALLAAAHEAAIDEIHHARISFAIASRLLGKDVGPGPLPVDGDLLGDTGLGAVVAETVREGCVGETLAAAEAQAASQEARQPAIVAAMACIARDEEAHAALAWKFVSWAVRRGDAAVGAAVRQAFASTLARFAGDTGGAPIEEYGGCGHLIAERAHAVRQEAIERLILPSVAALG